MPIPSWMTQNGNWLVSRCRLCTLPGLECLGFERMFVGTRRSKQSQRVRVTRRSILRCFCVTNGKIKWQVPSCAGSPKCGSRLCHGIGAWVATHRWLRLWYWPPGRTAQSCCCAGRSVWVQNSITCYGLSEVMLLADKNNIKEVILFPAMKPQPGDWFVLYF